MSQDTSATRDILGGYIVPTWFAQGESPPEPPPRWGDPIQGVRMYECDGEADQYNDIRYGRLDNDRIAIAVEGDDGYAFVDLADLLEWAKGVET